MITKEEIKQYQSRGGRITPKLLVECYYQDVIARVPYALIINRISDEFNIAISLGSFSTAVSRYIKRPKKETTHKVEIHKFEGQQPIINKVELTPKKEFISTLTQTEIKEVRNIKIGGGDL